MFASHNNNSDEHNSPVDTRGSEAGISDEKAMLQKIAKLERQLFDSQNSMELLVMKKEEWSSKYDGMRETVTGLQEMLKREKAKHLDFERRVENLLKALDSEKKYAAQLKRALCESGEGFERAKLQSSEAKRVETDAMLSGLKAKSMDLEKKLHVAEVKLEEANRKRLELGRKLEEVETRDSLFQREVEFFIAEREAQEASFSTKENDLQERERKLQENEDKLCEGQRITTEREAIVNETEMTLKLKEQDLKKTQKEIDLSTSVLKKKEDDINHRLANLTEQEHKAEALRSDLEMKDKELLALTEKLTARERIQMLLVEQCALLGAKMQEFEVGMDRKRQSLNDEKRSWLNFLKWKEDAVTCREEELGKLELHLQNKSERIKGKEKHLDANLRTLEEKGNLLKSDEKRLDLEKKQMLVDKDSLQTFKDEIEKMRTDISQRESKIQEKTENLKISEEERAEYLRMQAQLKEEIKFFEKFKQSEEDRLKNDRLAMKDHVKRELETLELEKETFATKMRQEQSLISEKAQLERRQMLNEFEQRRKDLEVDLQKKREELEAHMSERERAFMEERERDYNNMNYLNEAAQKDVEESRSKRCRTEKEIPLNKKQLEENQLEKHKGINELQVPNKKVKVEVGEQFIKDGEPFLFASSQDIASEKDDPTRPVEVTTCTSPEIQDLSAEGDVKLKTSETHDKSIEPVITEKIECNEEVNSMIPERSTENGGDEYEVISEDEDMDEESEGRVPIHKKIWNFFVT
ncbi:hypothetical protein ACET3Z_022239 [Daucus carota]